VRDREEMIEHEFPVFARHLVPTTGRSRTRVVEIGGTVTICGQKVASGDVIVADGTGIVCIPQEKAEQILAIAEALAADDAQAMKEIAAGLTFSEAMAKFRKI
jgi:regulator of RNase E activity RraA